MSSASEEHQHSHSHDHGHSHEHGHDHSHSHGPSSSSSTTASTSNESKGDASLNPPAAMINLGGMLFLLPNLSYSHYTHTSIYFALPAGSLMRYCFTQQKLIWLVLISVMYLCY